MKKWGVCLSNKNKMIILIVMVLLAGFPYLKAEVLTIKYGTEMISLLKNENSWDESVEPQFYRVITYSDKNAKLYYVAPNNQSAFLCTFVNENNMWKLENENLIWTKTGNGEDAFVWPYYPHN